MKNLFSVLLLGLFMLTGITDVFGQTQIRYWQIQDASADRRIMIFNNSSGEWEEGTLTGTDISLVDAGGNFTTDNVEAALSELATSSHAAATLNGGSSTALTLSGQELNLSDATLTTNLDIDHLVSLSGIATASDDYGTAFTGVTIPDGSNLLEAIQALETAIESTVDTDDQTIDGLTLSSTTISASLEDDGEAPVTLDIRPVVSRSFVQEEFSPAAAATTVTVVVTLPTDQDGIIVSRNGLTQRPGGGNDYTIAGQVLTFSQAFTTGELVIVEFPQE